MVDADLDSRAGGRPGDADSADGDRDQRAQVAGPAGQGGSAGHQPADTERGQAGAPGGPRAPRGPGQSREARREQDSPQARQIRTPTAVASPPVPPGPYTDVLPPEPGPGPVQPDPSGAPAGPGPGPGSSNGQPQPEQATPAESPQAQLTTTQAPVDDPVARYGQVDERLVDRLHDVSGRRLTLAITELQGDDTHLPYEDERALGRQVIYEILAEWRTAAYETGRRPLPAEVEERLAQEVHNRLYGLGALQPLIDDPDVVDIHIGGHNNVWVHQADGTKVRGPKAAPSDAALIDMIARQARRMGRSERRWDREEVSLDLQLPDGSRLHALREVTGRPVIDIRCHDFVQFERLSDLEERHVMDRSIHDFLSVAVRCGLNVILAGGKGMGKTTNLRCLINEVPPEERIITVEDSLELGIERFPDLHPDVESIEARPPNSEGHGEFTLADAVRQGLRMRGRIIVGEVRGDEVIPMLKAMSAGEDGSMCTIHAMSSANVFDRLAMYAAMSDGQQGFQPEVTAMLVANAVHFVVYLGWDNGTPALRRVQSIREVVGADGNQVISNEVWAPDQWGRAVPASRLRESSERLLADNGYDLRLRDNPNGWWSR